MMKIIKIVLLFLLYYFISIGLVALGWNVCLPKVFEVPRLNFSQLCWLTLSISFLGFPATYKYHEDND